MIRASFELKISAETLAEARDIAINKIASFMELSPDEIVDQISLEFKVSYPEAKTYGDIAQNMDSKDLVVVAFGSLKQNIVKHFGQ